MPHERHENGVPLGPERCPACGEWRTDRGLVEIQSISVANLQPWQTLTTVDRRSPATWKSRYRPSSAADKLLSSPNAVSYPWQKGSTIDQLIPPLEVAGMQLPKTMNTSLTSDGIGSILSGEGNVNVSATATVKSPDGIAGWLILAAVGLILQPLMTLQWMVRDRVGDFYLDFPSMISSGLDAVLGLYDVVILCLAVILWVLFFRHRRLVPQLMVVFCLGVMVRVVVYLCQIWDYEWLRYERPVWIALVFAHGIGIPYFLTSKRVKATFIR